MIPTQPVCHDTDDQGGTQSAETCQCCWQIGGTCAECGSTHVRYFDGGCDDCKRHIEPYGISDLGCEMNVCWEPDWLGGKWVSLMEFRCTTADQTPIPISNTGYRSHFPTQEQVDACGGPEADALAYCKAFHATAKTRQLGADVSDEEILRYTEEHKAGDQLGLF